MLFSTSMVAEPGVEKPPHVTSGGSFTSVTVTVTGYVQDRDPAVASTVT